MFVFGGFMLTANKSNQYERLSDDNMAAYFSEAQKCESIQTVSIIMIAYLWEPTYRLSLFLCLDWYRYGSLPHLP